MLNNLVIFGIPRCGSTHVIQLLEDYLIKNCNINWSKEHEYFNVFKNISNNLYIRHSIIKLHTWATYNNLIEYNLLNNKSIAVTRENKTEMFASWLIAMETNQWTLTAKDIHNKILPKKIIHMSSTNDGKSNILRYVHSIVRFDYFLKKYNLPIIRYENTFNDIKKLYPDWEATYKGEYLIKQNDHTRYDYIHKNDIDFFIETYNQNKNKSNLDWIDPVAKDNNRFHFKSDQYSCKAPWVSMYIGPNGDVSPCCTSLGIKLGNTNNSTLDDIWNSNASKKFRSEMTKNIPNPNCKFCYEQEKHGGGSLRTFLNREYNIPTKNLSLAPQLKLKYLDVRFSNECNQACIMCTPKLSNKLYDDALGFKEYIRKYQDYSGSPDGMSDEDWELHKGIISVSSKTIDELKELLKDVDHIYFAGGEPLIMKKHYEILDFLIERKLNEKVFLRYNTNLSTLKYKNINIIEKWKLFPKLNILPSADLNGERGTYQRWGFNWDKFKNNWLKIKNELPQTRLGMQITISALTIGYLPEFLNELEKMGCNEMNSNFVHGPADLNPQVLPPKLKKIYTNKLNRYISKTSNNMHKKLLLEATSFMNDINESDKNMWKRTLHRLDFLDKKRKTNWKSLWPEFIQ
jgi:radical SAM protein with 4Fe4S-binding SPASM domain